ncbi:unnamed protein product [Umbelopsis vinacea]
MTRLTSAFLVAVGFVGLIQAADNYTTFGICSCFTPKYDASCCILARGSQWDNVCETPDTGATVEAYENCCTASGGHYKCKYGYREPGGYPDNPGQYNCSVYQ